MLAMDLALRFMRTFYSKESSEQGLLDLKELLAEDLQFRGPFVQFDSAAAYIESLLKDPPRDMRYEIMHSYADENSTCLVYRFEKPGLSTVMAQVFEIRAGRISKIRLIFDSAAFASQ